jgi:hypothetical protein
MLSDLLRTEEWNTLSIKGFVMPGSGNNLHHLILCSHKLIFHGSSPAWDMPILWLYEKLKLKCIIKIGPVWKVYCTILIILLLFIVDLR